MQSSSRKWRKVGEYFRAVSSLCRQREASRSKEERSPLILEKWNAFYREGNFLKRSSLSTFFLVARKSWLIYLLPPVGKYQKTNIFYRAHTNRIEVQIVVSKYPEWLFFTILIIVIDTTRFRLFDLNTSQRKVPQNYRYTRSINYPNPLTILQQTRTKYILINILLPTFHFSLKRTNQNYSPQKSTTCIHVFANFS